MESSKLMVPLFFEGNFNRDGRRMRAVLVREISDGKETYRLWRSAGKPDLEYPRAENDKHLLYAEINGYLLPLSMTDYFLVDHCGFGAVVKALYGDSETRSRHFDELRKSEGKTGVLAALEAEKAEILRYGRDPACQTDYIRRILNKRVHTYLESRENNGKTFPDFIGALLLNDLANCTALSEVYKAQWREKEADHRARVAQEEKAYCKEQNQKFEQAVSDAVQIIQTGGVLKNDTVTFYHSRYDSRAYSIVNYLMRLYQVDVPLRTQGWINKRLSSVTIRDGTCSRFSYFRAKRGRGSQKFFVCMDHLIQAVAEQPLQQEGEKAA